MFILNISLALSTSVEMIQIKKKLYEIYGFKFSLFEIALNVLYLKKQYNF